MNQQEILALMRQWVAENDIEFETDDLENEPVANVITSSLDLVEFTLDLEESIDLQGDGFDLEALAPKFATLTFFELAGEIERLVNQR